MSKFITKIEHVPTISEYEISLPELYEELKPLGWRELHLWDTRYWYTAHEDWGKVFQKVLLDMPKYTAERFDCENYSLLTAARVAELFKLNTCGIAIGQSPLGYHGFNIFLSEFGLYYLEPQTADVFSVDEDSGYKAEIVIMG